MKESTVLKHLAKGAEIRLIGMKGYWMCYGKDGLKFRISFKNAHKFKGKIANGLYPRTTNQTTNPPRSYCPK